MMVISYLATTSVTGEENIEVLMMYGFKEIAKTLRPIPLKDGANIPTMRLTEITMASIVFPKVPLSTIMVVP